MAVYIQNGDVYATHSLYYVNFYGNTITTTVTADPEIVRQWISSTEQIHWAGLHRLIVGLDVEWRPSYSKQQNPASVVQLCVADRCLIFQIYWSPFTPPALYDFLNNRNYTFVGVSVQSDLEKLERNYGISSGGARSVDLARWAAISYNCSELRSWSLKNLAGYVLGKEMEKPRAVTMSEWDAEFLTPGQVKYACVDAYVSYEIGSVLEANTA